MPTSRAEPGWHLAECLLPGLTADRAAELTAQVSEELAANPGGPGLAGAIYVPGDEVLLCLFRGPGAEVRSASERAQLPFERIIGCLPVGWLPGSIRPGTAGSAASAAGPQTAC